MQEKTNNPNLNSKLEGISIEELFKILWQSKWVIISITAFISLLAVVISLNLPNIYQSKAVLAQVDSGSDISSALNSYSSIASIAGINLGSGGSKSNSIKAIETFKSLSFFEKYILPNIFLPDLMAVESWNSNANRLTYDQDIYDTTTNTWVRDFAYPKKSKPSAQESYKVFISKHLKLSQDSRTSFVYISINHQSPFIAKEWLELIISQINSFFREKEKLESNKVIAYLNEQITMTNFSEIKLSISQLLQEEIKKQSLIEAKQNYVFDYIDPPAVMEKKSEPNRTLIVILSCIFGVFISVFYLIIKYYITSNRTN